MIVGMRKSDIGFLLIFELTAFLDIFLDLEISTVITISIFLWNSNKYWYNPPMSKILVFHDTYLMRGWAERMNIEIAKWSLADIATAIWSPDCYDAWSMWFIWDIFEVDPGWRRGMFGFLRMKWQFYTSEKITANYDSILFSNEAITGIWRVKPGTKTYYYAHSISRHLFDQRSQYLAKVPLLARPFFLIFSLLLRCLYRRELAKIGTIFVNSEANKKRMSEWCGRDDAIIIYPGVDLEKFNIFDEKSISQIIAIEWITISYKWYYISFSRLTHAKRVDTIIRAFQQMQDKNIVILYGKHDSQKDEFIQLWRGYANIIFHELSDNNNLSQLIAGALSSICISAHEDFGMVAIESMACGVPTIAVWEWGYRESMIPGKTGYLIGVDDLENNLVEIIQKTSQETLRNMQWDCRSRARDFGVTVMNTKIQQYIQ